MKKIFVVEDDQQIAELLFNVLYRAGYEVTICKDGFQLFKALGSERPDLILLDVMLPGIDGFTIQNKLLENSECRNIPIIVMTSKDQVQEVFELATNVVDFFPKPFDVYSLIKRIHEIIPT